MKPVYFCRHLFRVNTGRLIARKCSAYAVEHLYAIGNVEVISRHMNLMPPLVSRFPSGRFPFFSPYGRYRNAIQGDKLFLGRVIPSLYFWFHAVVRAGAENTRPFPLELDGSLHRAHCNLTTPYAKAIGCIGSEMRLNATLLLEADSDLHMPALRSCCWSTWSLRVSGHEPVVFRCGS